MYFWLLAIFVIGCLIITFIYYIKRFSKEFEEELRERINFFILKYFACSEPVRERVGKLSRDNGFIEELMEISEKMEFLSYKEVIDVPEFSFFNLVYANFLSLESEEEDEEEADE